ncbi:MAG: ABC transporter substrate-binding protein [Rhodobacteraceae bacterium]|nr:MAG: ABC transporter substrate-binding protein [Paracoccaceae bacterium]
MKNLLLSAASLALVAGAALAEPQRGGRVDVVIQPEPPGLMVGLLQNAPVQMVAGNIYEGLLRYDADLAPQPGLAREWEVSEDGLVYTFRLAENARWHDGEPFTAEDVVFSVDVFLRETHPRLRASLVHVETIEAVDDHTVRFTLNNPFGPFLGLFEVGTMPMVPKHIYEGTDFANNPMNDTPIGTGPFRFNEWVQGSHIHLVRNDDYHVEGMPYLDEIFWRVIPDAAARAVAFETGQVDVLPGGSVENFDVPRLTAMDGVCVTGGGWEFFGPHSWMWINLREGPTTDVRFRRAIMHAMDREFARDVVWNGFGRVASGPVSSSTRFFSDDVTIYDYDPDKARALLAEMAYDGTPIRLVPLPYGETWQRWGEAVRQNLLDVGINVELVATDVAGWNQRTSEWDFDLAFTFLYQFGDPALGVARTYVSTNIAKGSPWNNVSGYVNEEVDRLFAEAAVAVGDEARQALYDEVQRIIVDDVPVAWLLELEFPTIYRCDLENLVTTAIGVNDGFRDAWLSR